MEITMDVILAPDVFVNASVAPGSAPDQVIQRLFAKKAKTKTTPWILERVEAMLLRVPSFKKDAVKPQIQLIQRFVATVDGQKGLSPDAWESALVDSANVAAARRVITDHPDLLAKGTSGGVEFISTEEWLLEEALPPPPPGQ